MMMRYVHFESRLCVVATLTHGTSVRLTVVVRANVRFQVITTRERSRAMRTLVVLFARMQTHMTIETASMLESLAAYFAFKLQEIILIA